MRRNFLHRNIRTIRNPFKILFGLFLCIVFFDFFDIFHNFVLNFLYIIVIFLFCFFLVVLFSINWLSFIKKMWKFFIKKDNNSDKTHKNKEISVLEDTPIKSEKEDKLGRNLVVDKVLKFIEHDYAECARICISGKWGEGKTSVLNIVEDQLDKTIYEYINVEPWFYNDIDSAQKSILRLLGNKISENFPFPDVNKSMEKYIAVLAGGVLEHFTGIRFPYDNQTPESIKKDISDYIAETGKKYILVFDDLDRLEDKDFKLIIKTIMSLSTIKGLIIIMLMDIEEASKKYEYGNYLGKIITITVPLPKIEPLKYAEILGKEIKKIFSKEDSDKFEESDYQYGFLRLLNFNTLRNIKRFIIMFDVFYNKLKGEVNVIDLYAVVYLYLFYLEIYNDMYANKEMYIKVKNKPYKPDEKYFNNLLEPYDKDRKKDLFKVLSKIASKFKYKIGGEEVSYKDLDDAINRSFSIVNETSFYKYFIFKPSDNDISDVLIKTKLKKWKNEESNDDISDFLKSNSEKLKILLEKLNMIYANEIPELLLKRIIECLINMSIPEKYFLSNNNNIHSEIISLLEKIHDNREEFIRELITEGKALDILWYIANHYDRIIEHNDLEKLLSKKIDRMPAEEVLENLHFRIFKIYIDGTMLNRIVADKKENFRKKDFFNLIKNDKKWVMKFVMTRTIRTLAEGYTFYIQELTDFYGEDFIEKIIVSFKDKKDFTEAESKDYDEFCEKYSEYKNSKSAKPTPQ